MSHNPQQDSTVSSSEFDPVKELAFIHRETERMLRDSKFSAAALCYYYPQYDLESALDIPNGDRELLIGFARYERYDKHLTDLSIAGSSGNKKAYKKLYSNLEKTLDRIRKQI